MSGWYKRAKSFVAKSAAKAADVEGEFDNIEEAFNGLFKAGRVQASGKGTLTGAYSDIPGASADLVVAVPSLLIAVVTFDISAREADTFIGNLNMDGVTGQEAAFAPTSSVSGIRVPVTQTYFKKLAAGTRTIKMVAKKNGSSPEIFSAANSGFTYLLIPDPEP
jgi:hypothetical protein